MAVPIDTSSISKSQLELAYRKLKRKKQRDQERALRAANERYQLLVDQHDATKAELTNLQAASAELKEKALFLVDELDKVFALVGHKAPEGTPFLEQPRRAIEAHVADLRKRLATLEGTNGEGMSLATLYEDVSQYTEEPCDTPDKLYDFIYFQFGKIGNLEEGLEHVFNSVHYDGDYPEGCPAEMEPGFAVQQTMLQLRHDQKELQDRLAAIHRAHKGRPVSGCDTCENAS